MNKHRLLPAVLAGALFLGSCTGVNVATDGADDALPPCTEEGTMFAGQKLFPNVGTKAWGDLALVEPYHARVSEVIEEYRGIIGLGDEDEPETENAEETDEAANVRADGAILRCTEENYRDVVPAGPALRRLAEELQPWKEGALDIEDLSASDTVAVLAELLREYECTLEEYDRFVEQRVQTDMRGGAFGPQDLANEKARRQRQIAEELQVARPALERTLLLLSGAQRLHPLVADIECILRTSVDLRNAMALVSTAASCMGRTTDARSPLRF